MKLNKWKCKLLAFGIKQPVQQDRLDTFWRQRSITAIYPCGKDDLNHTGLCAVIELAVSKLKQGVIAHHSVSLGLHLQYCALILRFKYKKDRAIPERVTIPKNSARCLGYWRTQCARRCRDNWFCSISQRKKSDVGSYCHNELLSEKVKTDPELSWRYTVPGWEATDTRCLKGNSN